MWAAGTRVGALLPNKLSFACPHPTTQRPLCRDLLIQSLGREEEVGLAHNPHLHNANHASHGHSGALQVVHTAHGSLIVETTNPVCVAPEAPHDVGATRYFPAHNYGGNNGTDAVDEVEVLSVPGNEPIPTCRNWNVDVAPVATGSTPQLRGMKKDWSAPLAMESQSVCEVPDTPVGPMPRRRDSGVDMAPTSMEATPQFRGAKRDWAAPLAMRAGTGDTGTPIVRMTEDASQGPCHTPQYEPRPCEQEINDILVEEDRFSQIGQMDPNKIALFHTFLQQPP